MQCYSQQPEKPPTVGNDILSSTQETPESKLFKRGSSLASRMSVDRKIQCTEVDMKGDIVASDKEINRSELVSKVPYNNSTTPASPLG